MRLVILGSSASYAEAGRACAGYLVEHDGTHVLFDCGHGALANLGHVLDPLDLDAVFVTHAHPDHVVDLYALQSLLRYAPEGPAPAVPLYGPSGLLKSLSCLLSQRSAEELCDAFVDLALAPGEVVHIGQLIVRVEPVDHAETSFGFWIEGAGRLFYSGDAMASERLVDAASGCDILLAEATLPDAYAGKAPHMTAREAGEVAAAVGARELILTHVWPTSDRRRMVEDARRVFDGDVVVAEELMELPIG